MCFKAAAKITNALALMRFILGLNKVKKVVNSKWKLSLMEAK